MKTSRAPSICKTAAAIFIIAAALSFPVYKNGISMLDEGAMLYISERLTAGDVLYRDIVTGVMPGSYYLVALFLKLFGHSIITERMLASATLAGVSVLIYAISQHFVKKRTSLLITALFISTAIPSYWMAGYSQFSIAMVLLSLLFFLRYLDSLSPTALIISGASAGLAFLFKQNYGVFITAGLGSILMARLIIKKEWKPLLIFSIPLIAPVLAAGLYLYSEGALAKMAQYTIVSLFKKAANAYYKPYPLLAVKNPFFFTHQIANFIPFRYIALWSLKEGIVKEIWIYMLAALIYLLPPLVIALGVMDSGLGIIRQKARWKEITLVLVSLLLFLGVFPRSDIPHLIFILPPVMITGALIAERLPLSGGALFATRGLAFIITGLFSLLCLSSSYLSIMRPLPERGREPLGLPRAEGIRVERHKARIIRAVTNHIKEKTAPDEPILVVPTGAMYYFLTQRKSAVPYPLIMPGAMDENVVINAMEKRKLPYIVYSDMSFDGQPLSRHMPRIHAYITKNYHIDETYPMAGTGGAAYVLKRGFLRDKIIPIGREIQKAGREMPLYYDFVKNLDQARSGLISGKGHLVPLSRSNQVSVNAWLLKDAILQKPGKRWSKVYTAFGLHIPPGSALRFSMGQSPVVWDKDFGDGALFEIFVYDLKAENLEKIFSRYIDPKNNIDDRKWFTYMADLKKYWGRDLIISFVTSGGPRFNLTLGKINRWKQIDLAGWGGVGLVSIQGDKLTNDGGVQMAGAALPGEALKKMARFDDISFFLEEEKKYPGDYDVHLALGSVYDRSGKTDKAVKEFSAALKTYPAGSEARNRLARYLLKTGNMAKAEALLSRGLGLSPQDARLNMTMADLYRRRKQYDKAVAAYGRVLRMRPKDEWARLGRARSYLATGRAGRAEADAEKALRAHPRSSAALTLLGDIARFKKEWKRAEKKYKEALEIGPKSSAAAYKLGLALEGAGKRDEALRAYRNVVATKGVPESTKDLAGKAIASILEGAKEQD